MSCPFPPGGFPPSWMEFFAWDLFDYALPGKLLFFSVVCVAGVCAGRAVLRRVFAALGIVLVCWTSAGCGRGAFCHKPTTGCEQEEKKDQDSNGFRHWSAPHDS
jgi:hypothetical protein